MKNHIPAKPIKGWFSTDYTPLANALSDTYRWSIRSALITPTPEGVVYILENTLEQLAKFDIYHLPVHHTYSFSTSSDGSSSRSDIRGFPNTTNLREAINIAQYLSREWSTLNPIEQSRGMAEIRAKIQPEDMWLDSQSIGLSEKHSEIDIYWFQYEISDIVDLGIHYYGSGQ